MRRLNPAVIDPAILAELQANPPARGWKSRTNNVLIFKRRITEDMVVNQSRRCAYCGMRLLGEEHHRDHIAPVEHHQQFTFEVRNLVLACYFCNSECKWRTDTVANVAQDYAQCVFTIVHPILDEPTEHLRYIGHRLKVLVQAVDGSAKGQTTIDMFDLASPDRCKMRTKDLWLDSDLEHLHGKWKHLFEQVIFAPLPQRVVMRLRP